MSYYDEMYDEYYNYGEESVESFVETEAVVSSDEVKTSEVDNISLLIENSLSNGRRRYTNNVDMSQVLLWRGVGSSMLQYFSVTIGSGCCWL